MRRNAREALGLQVWHLYFPEAHMQSNLVLSKLQCLSWINIEPAHATGGRFHFPPSGTSLQETE